MNQLQLNFYFSPLLHEYSRSESPPTYGGFALRRLRSLLARDAELALLRVGANGPYHFCCILFLFYRLWLTFLRRPRHTVIPR